MENESLQLGGNIQLKGFSTLEPSKLIVVKKIIGNYTKRFSEATDNFQEITLTLKSIHGEQSNNFEMKAKLLANGGPFTSEINDRNIFFGIDKVLKNIEEQVSK
jgi:ribosome-associated translation inhibitor RaiA